MIGLCMQVIFVFSERNVSVLILSLFLSAPVAIVGLKIQYTMYIYVTIKKNNSDIRSFPGYDSQI